MRVERYNQDRHRRMLEGWAALRDATFPVEHTLSTFGIVVPELAAGFLYRTDSSVGVVEGFISNPEAPQEMRERAFDMIAQELIEEAKRARMSYLVGWSNNQRTVDLAVKHGFEKKDLEIQVRKDL